MNKFKSIIAVMTILFSVGSMAMDAEGTKSSENIFRDVNPIDFYRPKELLPQNRYEMTQKFQKYFEENQKPEFIVVEQENGQMQVFGMTEQEVLAQVENDQGGEACAYENNNLANRWCHGLVVKVISESLKQRGYNSIVASLIGASFFIPKEYLIDDKPASADFVLADVPVYESNSINKDRVQVTVFMDGVYFINYNFKF